MKHYHIYTNMMNYRGTSAKLPKRYPNQKVAANMRDYMVAHGQVTATASVHACRDTRASCV